MSAQPITRLGVKVGRKVAPVDSLLEASEAWLRFRSEANLGASESPVVWVVDLDTGARVARLSYNGRVWTPDGATEIRLKDGAETAQEADARRAVA